MVHQTDDVEAIGYNARIREMLADHGPVDAGQIHADDADRVLAGKALEVGLQGGLTAPQNHIEDLVMAQVAERRGIAVPAREEMFFDPEHLGTRRPLALG